MKKKVFVIILLVVTFVICEFLAAQGLSYLQKSGKIKIVSLKDLALIEDQKELTRKIINNETEYMDFSAGLGWTVKPGARSDVYATNSQGLRNSREFLPGPPQGMVRLASFGDSFTHGDDVNNEETWQEILMKDHPQIEALNFGVPGYGADQAFFTLSERG